MTKFEQDLSKGSVFKKLIVFSIPFLLSNLIQSIYSVADMIIVGRFSGDEVLGTINMSGVNIGSQVTMLLTNAVFGLCVGATVMIGQYLGSGQREKMRKTIGTLFTTLIFLGFGLTALMVFLRKPLLLLIRTPEDSFSASLDYFTITSFGIIFIFGYNALSAVMRGMGDSRRPLWFVAIAAVTNIILDLLLVGAFHMGSAGAAYATVASQALSMLLCILYLTKNDFVFDFKISSFKIDKAELKTLLKVGIPNSVQNVATSISFLFLTALVNGLGVAASAAVGAVGKFNGFAILPGLAMSSAVSAMSAQNIGAGELKRAKKTTFLGTAIAISISLVIFIAAQLFPETILAVFGGDPEMIAQGTEYLRIFSYDYLIAPILFCFNGLFIGSGHTVVSLCTGMISSILVRIPAAWVFGVLMEMGLTGIGLGAPLASFIALALSVIFFMTGRWKKLVILNHTPAE